MMGLRWGQGEVKFYMWILWEKFSSNKSVGLKSWYACPDGVVLGLFKSWSPGIEWVQNGKDGIKSFRITKNLLEEIFENLCKYQFARMLKNVEASKGHLDSGLFKMWSKN